MGSKKIKNIKKFISWFLAIVIVFVSIPLMPSYSADRAMVPGKIVLGDSVINYTQDLKKNNDGSFTFTIDLNTSYAVSDKNENSKVSKNGYFTAAQSGMYLVELWGGDGANGESTSYSNGGNGGEGGHIYGIVHLNVGETLFWQLGGNGIETMIADQGGGVNGDGGGHGDVGTYTVGGGGGFSAVYKFPANEFESNYTKDSGAVIDDISITDRTSKYIMIAGGGGGGGAGNGWSSTGNVTGTPDGGQGGSIGSATGILTGTDVNGTFFSGADGKSSGTSTAYVGRGGTNIPGEVADTLLSLSSGKKPNDWKGTANPNYLGGRGGSGELRGGGGGAGFCGGSGGIMTSILIPNNVGGGGGGSSFIASEVTYQNLSTSITSQLLQENPAEHGGAIQVTYLEHTGGSEITDIDFSASLTQYFTLQGVRLYNSTYPDGVMVAELKDEGQTPSPDGMEFTVVDQSLTTNSDGTSADHIKIEVMFLAKEKFAGGNNVPVFKGSIINCKSGVSSVDIPVSADCGHVNVPYNIEINPHSHITNVAGKQYALTELYTDNYAEVRAHINEGAEHEEAWRYDFIKEISEYYIIDSLFNKVTTDTVAPMLTTKFYVTVDVFPENTGIAKVGDPLSATSLNKHAIITILTDHTGDLNGNNVDYSKNLQYDGEKYILSLNIDSDAKIRSVTTPDALQMTYLTNGNPDDDVVTLEEEIEASGTYRVALWGGNGGEGGGSLFGSGGGSGGSGGFIGGYIHLDKGDLVYVGLGKNGANASSMSQGGKAGGVTAMRVGEDGAGIADATMVMIAGSGGGGGGSNWLVGTSDPGGNVENTVKTGTLTAAECSGSAGTNAGTFSSGNGGSAGKNYFNSSYMKSELTSEETALMKANYSASTSGGGISLVCVELDPVDKAEGIAELSDYTLDAQFSQYFDIDQKNIKVFNTNDAGLAETEVTGASVSLLPDNYLQLSNIDPTVNEAGTEITSGESVEVTHVRFRIDIPFNPKDGFLGGNDVPVIVSTASLSTGMRFGQEVADTTPAAFDVWENNATDFANVEINAEAYVGTLETHDKYRSQGAPGVHRLELYDWTRASLPTGADSWKADFVQTSEVIMLASDGTVVEDDPITPNPDVTTTYTVEVGIVPLRDAVYATVIDSVDGQTVQKEATIYVTTYLTYKLENITTSDNIDEFGNVNVVPGYPHEATLTPAEGWLLPETISVTNDADGSPVNHIYNKDTGYLHIAEEELNEPITILASALQEKHKLYYVYQNYENDEVKEYGLGSTENPLIYDEFACKTNLSSVELKIDGDIIINDYPGHTFSWEWTTEDGNRPTEMPHGDLWVIGTYKANEYNLTINYYKADTDEKIAESTSCAVLYGNEFSITSPVIEGFIADKPVVNGKMGDFGATDTVIDVRYTPTQNQLNIIYIASDTNTVVETYVESIETDKQYSIATPERTGYTPDISVVKGTMDADGNTYYVYYNPNHYTVTFNPMGGTVTQTTKEAVYNNVYMYDGASQTYTALPTPVKVGYTFAGWYLGNTPVADDTKVVKAEDHVLTASWQAVQYRVIVHYHGEFEEILHPEYNEFYEYGSDYRIESPDLTSKGYVLADLEQEVITGTVPAQNTVITVKYVKAEHTLTINYLYADNVEDTDLHGTIVTSPYAVSLANGAIYSVNSPKIEHYTPSQEVVSGTMGTSDITVNVYYYDKEIQISVTVGWGDMTYSYSYGRWNPDTHQYSVEPIEPTAINANKITVSNNSDIGVSADFAYEPATEYTEVSGYFTSQDKASGTRVTGVDLAATDSKSVWLWLDGVLRDGLSATITSGICKVIIRGGAAHAL